MTNNNKHAAFARRSAIALAISMCFATAAMAQSSEGSIYGQVQTAKAKVILLNLENGSTRQIEAEKDGRFSFSKVSPGRYKVTSGNLIKEVEVAMGTGTEVQLLDSNTVIVAGSRKLPTIDMNSVESNTVFTQSEIQKLPVARDVTAVSLLAPGAVQGDSNWNLPSISGASVAENGYYINGMDVTNIRNFIGFATLHFDAIEQQQVKTGGYSAEYGRSLGGVVALTSKRGTNQWKSGVSAYWQPNGLRPRGMMVSDKEVVTNPNGYTVFNGYNTYNSTEVNAYTGGPIIKDKLFVFGLLRTVKANQDLFGKTSSTAQESGKPNGMIKLDYLPNGDHRFEFTGITNNTRATDYEWLHPASSPYASHHIGDPKVSINGTRAHVLIGKYTGYLSDNLTFSVLGGKTHSETLQTTGAKASKPYDPSCPRVTGTKGERLGCYPYPHTSSRDPNAPNNYDKRKNFRMDLEYTWDNHTFRAGLDDMEFTSSSAGTITSSGGKEYTYVVSTTGSINGVPNVIPKGSDYVQTDYGYGTSGIYTVKNNSKYIDDNWKVTKNLLVTAGLRWESFKNSDTNGVPFVDKKNLFAPRLGASWNVLGDGSIKLYANAGRYFIPVASGSNILLTRTSASETRFYTYQGKEAKTDLPLGMVEIGQAILNGTGRPPNPATVVDPNLKPMNQDEFILGFQQALNKTWNYGVKYTNRRVNQGMDDYCGTKQIADYVKSKGYAKFKHESLSECVLMNPGEDLTLKMNLQNDGNFVPFTVPASALGLAAYERLYDALEFTLNGQFDEFNFSASYVSAKSRGTAEGYVQSNLNQSNAGMTQDFDFGSLTDGAYGPLPNSRRHALKLFGNYRINQNFALGVNARVSSGRPTSCIGFVPTTVPDYLGAGGTTQGGSGSYTSASSYYCLNKDGVNTLKARGSGPETPWLSQLDLSLNYSKDFGDNMLEVKLQIANLLNSKTVTEWNERGDYSRSTSKAPPVRYNLNYMSPTSFQGGRSMSISGRYSF